MPKEYTRQFSLLGHIPTFGSILLFDDFEGGWHSHNSSTTQDDVMILSAEAAYNGKAGLYIATDHISPAANDFETYGRYFPWPISNKIRLRLNFWPIDEGNLGYLEFHLTYDDSASKYEGRIRYDGQNHLWQYYNSAGNWTNITDGSHAPNSSAWHYLDFTIDKANNTFTSLLCDNLNLNLSNLALKNPSTENVVFAILTIKISTAASAAVGVYIDNLLITQSPD